jgi:hypothetical protein
MGISTSGLLVEALVLILFFGLPMISLIDLAKRKLTGIPLAIWAVFLVVIPLMARLPAGSSDPLLR